MTKLDFARTRDLLQQFDFKTLFIEELGWLQPGNRQDISLSVEGDTYKLVQIAQAGVVIFEVISFNGKIPSAKVRSEVQREASKTYHENVLIFVDRARTQSLWRWVKRENGKSYPRDHHFAKGQPGDLFLSKLNSLVVEMSELDEEGKVPITTAVRKIHDSLDIERVTKKFFGEFRDKHQSLMTQIQGIGDERDKVWYASVLLNRLMFVYFLQRKGFLDNGNLNYLQNKMEQSKQRGENRYYKEFLNALFFQAFALPEAKRTIEAKALTGKILYLSGSIFLKHPIEQRWPGIYIADSALKELLDLFGRYSWNLDDTPGGNDNEINPEVLGYIFEKYINQKEFGAYYTRPEITEYLCEATIHALILDKVSTPGIPDVLQERKFDSISELLMNLDATLCRTLLHETLPRLSLLDPACGSGAFLVTAMKTLINIYSAVIGRIDFLTDHTLSNWKKQVQTEHPSLAYFIKKKIITENLFGVDIMEEATEIARLRLFLALVASAQKVDDLEPLPNIDFNILAGNSLIGLHRVDDREFEQKRKENASLFDSPETYRHLTEEKNRLTDLYRQSSQDYGDHLQELRDKINSTKAAAQQTLNELLLQDFADQKIMYEMAVWDDIAREESKKLTKRALVLQDIANLHPFHWDYEFDAILNQRGGFDAIITNPPWEILKPNAKEFFQNHSELVTKNKMTILEFEDTKSDILQNVEIRKAWLKYKNGFPFVSSYYRTASQYKNQISVVNGKKAGTDINLYKLFTEQCFNLLRPEGICGIVIPSGIYTDLGTKQLRKLLFTENTITGLFCFENRKAIFEDVHRSFKFVALTFRKGGATTWFPTAFMRHDAAELKRFPQQGALVMPVELITSLSPDSLSIMEFKTEQDMVINEKMWKFPLLGEKIVDSWNLSLTNEFHMTNDKQLFKTSPGPGRLPLYEGKMIHQFTHLFGVAKYWVEESEGRKALLKRGDTDTGQPMDYQYYRLAHRSIASSTNERTMIASLLPPNVFYGHSLNASKNNIKFSYLLYNIAIFNSFVFDYALRQRVSANLTMFYIYQMPVPRLTEKDAIFTALVNRAARLICTTPEFDALASETAVNGYREEGVTDTEERARLRAELDGLVAHLYGLTEEELKYILETFPLVSSSVKTAVMQSYRSLAKEKKCHD